MVLAIIELKLIKRAEFAMLSQAGSARLGWVAQSCSPCPISRNDHGFKHHFLHFLGLLSRAATLATIARGSPSLAPCRTYTLESRGGWRYQGIVLLPQDFGRVSHLGNGLRSRTSGMKPGYRNRVTERVPYDWVDPAEQVKGYTEESRWTAGGLPAPHLFKLAWPKNYSGTRIRTTRFLMAESDMSTLAAEEKSEVKHNDLFMGANSDDELPGSGP
ncbi:hypothetical protein CaCOL14_013169 [Colletotrichum acutatum]